VTERIITLTRSTRETRIELTLDLSRLEPIELTLPLPFFEHMLRALAFHGGFSLKLRAEGDIEVDPHHLVEDIGLVLGDALSRIPGEYGAVARFGHSVIPMDDALSEATIDACGRPYLVYEAVYPQPRAGSFDMALIREFLLALTNTAAINLHALCRYGKNSHHMVEALFKAVGKALAQAYEPAQSAGPRSTKGMLSSRGDQGVAKR
jgi:imidazoleglycerol-phosphate dehydratase